MSPENSSPAHSNFSEFIPLASAVTLVSYSRDYIRRLAREGKIKSRQIDKEWFVNRQALLNFFETSAVEDSVKKRILSLSRKNDLEVKDFYFEKVSRILARQSHSPNIGLALAILTISGGLLSGLLLHQAAMVTSHNPNVSLGELLAIITSLPNQAAVVAATEQSANVIFSDTIAEETTEQISMGGGVVLFPAVSQGNLAQVETFFSDEVEVVVTSSTTGFVRNKSQTTKLPFVRIPAPAP